MVVSVHQPCRSLPESLNDCPMEAILKLVMGQWTAYILWMLKQQGPSRFGQIRRAIHGISAKVLTDRLRTLEAYSIVTRTVQPTRPPEVVYSLTERGDELVCTIAPLYDLACRWIQEDQADSV